VLRALAWLGRSPESFVPGWAGAPDEARLPTSAIDALRFDARALYGALEGERAAARFVRTGAP
jgi:hypothetical protein